MLAKQFTCMINYAVVLWDNISKKQAASYIVWFCHKRVTFEIKKNSRFFHSSLNIVPISFRPFSIEIRDVFVENPIDTFLTPSNRISNSQRMRTASAGRKKDRKRKTIGRVNEIIITCNGFAYRSLLGAGLGCWTRVPILFRSGPREFQPLSQTRNPAKGKSHSRPWNENVDCARGTSDSGLAMLSAHENEVVSKRSPRFQALAPLVDPL